MNEAGIIDLPRLRLNPPQKSRRPKDRWKEIFNERIKYNPEIPINNNLAKECFGLWSLEERTTGGITPSGGEIELFLPAKLNESIKTKLESFG